MTLKEMPKVGEKVRYIGKKGAINRDVTCGTVYSINVMCGDLASFTDNSGEDRTVIFYENLDKFELVTEPSEPTPVEASPSVIELLANISRRLYEAERYIAMQKRENELTYEHASELERQNREQAYEINELYKAVADRG